jgi:hypothetical protein
MTDAVFGFQNSCNPTVCARKFCRSSSPVVASVSANRRRPQCGRLCEECGRKNESRGVTKATHSCRPLPRRGAATPRRRFRVGPMVEHALSRVCKSEFAEIRQIFDTPVTGRHQVQARKLRFASNRSHSLMKRSQNWSVTAGPSSVQRPAGTALSSALTSVTSRSRSSPETKRTRISRCDAR